MDGLPGLRRPLVHSAEKDQALWATSPSLRVWQDAHMLVLDVYRTTAHWPDEEKFGLIAQTRRAAYSIAGNIAEGCGRNTDPELARFLRISLGSAAELWYAIVVARDLGYLAPSDSRRMLALVVGIRRMLSGLVATASARGRANRAARRTRPSDSG